MPDTKPNFKLPSVSAAEALAKQSKGAVLLDLRKPLARSSDGRTVLGAEIRDPFALHHDDPLMSLDQPIVAFCVHGHEVSQFGCAMLMLHGRDAVYVRGGFEALVAADATLTELPR